MNNVAIIMDNGSGMFKAAFARDNAPIAESIVNPFVIHERMLYLA